MTNDLRYVCYLVQKKNDLNRKRRRFMSISRPSRRWKKIDPNGFNYDMENLVEIKVKEHKAFTKEYAEQMIRVVQTEMKSMTPEMKRAAKEIGAKYSWSWHGAVHCIQFENQFLYAFDIARLASFYEADAILLGEKL